MLRLSRDQIDAPRAEALARLWRSHAERAALSPQETADLQEPMVRWLLVHGIARAENVDFAMTATARSRGAFLSADPVREAMRLSGGDCEMALSAIRRQTLALAAQAPR